MSYLNRDDISCLIQYEAMVRKTAKEFYAENFQPKAEIKENWIQKFGDFDEPCYVINMLDSKIRGNDDEIYQKVADAGYHQVMHFVPGGTALTYIVKNDNDEWALLRGWKRWPREERDNNPTVLQPASEIKRIFLEDAPPLEILPLVPIIHPAKISSGMVMRYAAGIFEGQFQKAGIRVEEDIDDMGILPSGQIVFADPGHSRRADKDTTDQQIQDAFADYKEATREYPAIHHLFDYVQPDGTRTQNLFFK